MSRRRYPHPLFGDRWFADDRPAAPRPPRHAARWPDPRDYRRPPLESDPDMFGARQPARVPADERADEPPTRSIPVADTPADAAPDRDEDKQRLRDALRELERSRERVERDAERVADAAKRDLIAQLLPVLDNLDRSIAAAVADASPLRDGVELVRAQFEKVLLGYGVEKLDAVGRPFDPNEHDAVAVVTVDDHRSDGVVIDEWEPGYRLGDRILRAAKVRVGKLAA